MRDGAPDKQVDPVCEMPIEPHRAFARREWQGVWYYFCSQDCVDKFEFEPSAFALSGEPGPARPRGSGRTA